MKKYLFFVYLIICFKSSEISKTILHYLSKRVAFRPSFYDAVTLHTFNTECLDEKIFVFVYVFTSFEGSYSQMKFLSLFFVSIMNCISAVRTHKA